jgi:hypothetical protein
MGPDEENCDSTLGGLYAACGQADGGSAISPPADPFLGTAEDPGESESEVVLCVTALPPLEEPQTVENEQQPITTIADKYDWEWYDKLERPRTYSDCLRLRLGSEHRPCPFVSCEHHLMLQVINGKVYLNHGTDDIDKLPYTCAAYEASGDTLTLEAIAQRLDISKERVRQLQNEAIGKLKDGRQEPLREFEFWEAERTQREED